MIRLFHYLSLLNTVDALITYYGLEKAFITELNPLMGWMYGTNPSLFILAKLSLSVFLYLFIVFKVVPDTRLIRGLTVIASFFYSIVFCLHCWWLLHLS